VPACCGARSLRHWSSAPGWPSATPALRSSSASPQHSRRCAQLLIYGIYTAASGVLLSDEVPNAHEPARGEADKTAVAGGSEAEALSGGTRADASQHTASAPGPAEHAHAGSGQGMGQPLLARGEAAYLCGLAALEVYCSAVHPLVLAKRLPFLPLLLTSVYCAAGMAWAWWRLARPYLRPPLRAKAE
jgi:hypothetical protein